MDTLPHHSRFATVDSAVVCRNCPHCRLFAWPRAPRCAQQPSASRAEAVRPVWGFGLSRGALWLYNQWWALSFAPSDQWAQRLL